MTTPSFPLQQWYVAAFGSEVGRTRGSRNKKPGAACRPGAGVVSVNIFFWKILVTRVKRKIELPLSPSISSGSRLFP